jgi:hypothetical protein
VRDRYEGGVIEKLLRDQKQHTSEQPVTQVANKNSSSVTGISGSVKFCVFFNLICFLWYFGFIGMHIVSDGGPCAHLFFL